jgi:hypothetical protein
LQLDSHCCQTRRWCKMTVGSCDTLVHEKTPSNAEMTFLS